MNFAKASFIVNDIVQASTVNINLYKNCKVILLLNHTILVFLAITSIYTQNVTFL